jgi:hypothetical protein
MTVAPSSATLAASLIKVHQRHGERLGDHTMRFRRFLLLTIPAVAAACSTTGGAASGQVVPPSSSAFPAVAVATASAPAATPTSVATARTSTPVATAPASPLEGVWHTGPVTPDDMRAALTSAGLQKWIQPFMATDAAPGTSNVYTLRVLNDRWILYWAKDGALAMELDAGRYVIDGDRVTVNHVPDCSDTYGWSVDGDSLTLSVLSNTCATPVNAVPEHVMQTALYLASPWMAGKP